MWAAGLAREEPVEERRAYTTDVQPAGRARRVPDPDLCVVLHNLNLTQVALGRAAVLLPAHVSLKWFWRRTPGSSGLRLDLQSRILEVEVPFDASSHLVADAAFAPEPGERGTLGTQQFPRETLVCQGAGPRSRRPRFARLVGDEAPATVLVEIAHPGEVLSIFA